MSVLVSLQTKQPKWSKPSEQIFIGKDILELLSTSMYIDPLTMYREYIQNAADAHDADAAKSGALRCIRGTPLNRAAQNRRHPFAAPTFENRLRIRSNSPSQTSR